MNAEKTSKSKREKKPGRLFRRLKRFFIVVFFLVIALSVTNWIWTNSGSNEWKQVTSEDGIEVHSLKVPGSFVLQLKAKKRMKTTLGGLISAMQDVDAMCTDGCVKAKIIERVDSDDSQIVYTYSLFDMPAPLSDREWVLENKFSQDTSTLTINYLVSAVPHIVPPVEEYIRITHFNNKWYFIPVGNGEVDVEWYIDMSYNGYVADLFHNLVIPKLLPESLRQIEELIKDEKYQNAKFDFVKEMEDVRMAELKTDS